MRDGGNPHFKVLKSGVQSLLFEAFRKILKSNVPEIKNLSFRGALFAKKEIISLEKQFKSPKVFLVFFFEENVPCSPFILHLC